mmetsp:Transcript_3278/g.5105  ORF Transcript_3278/g.5105 Transcript_3278/m.5105 type:complete len:353 (-) Transcript_3278:33-1091(-)
MKTMNGMTCLHIATASNSIRVTRYLVDNIQDLKFFDEGNKWGETALHVAAAAGNADIVEILLKRGVDYKLRDNWKRSAYKVAMENGYDNVTKVFHVYITDTDIATYCSTDGDSIDDDDGNPHYPNSHHYKNEMNKLLGEEFRKKILEAKASSKTVPVVKEKHIFSSLHSVSKADCIPQPNVDERNIHESDCIARENSVMTSPVSLSLHHSVSSRVTALSKYIEYPGDPDVVANLLLRNDIDPVGCDMTGYSALHKFCSYDKVDLIELLLPYISDTDIMAPASNKEGYTCLHVCVDMCAWNALSYMLKTRRVDKAAKDKLGRTFIDLACLLGRIETVQSIVSSDMSEVILECK